MIAKVKLALLAVALVFAILSGWTLRGWNDGAVQEQFDAFKVQVKAEGEAAQKKAAEQTRQDKILKEKIDEHYKAAIDKLLRDNERMRSQRASGDFLPAPGTGSRSPETICFNRAELERAIRVFDTEVQGLVEEGDTTALKLETAIDWARSR